MAWIELLENLELQVWWGNTDISSGGIFTWYTYTILTGGERRGSKQILLSNETVSWTTQLRFLHAWKILNFYCKLSDFLTESSSAMGAKGSLQDNTVQRYQQAFNLLCRSLVLMFCNQWASGIHLFIKLWDYHIYHVETSLLPTMSLG